MFYLAKSHRVCSYFYASGVWLQIAGSFDVYECMGVCKEKYVYLCFAVPYLGLCYRCLSLCKVVIFNYVMWA